MLCLLGKTASGKDSICRRLVKEHGFHKIITYTTRPMRSKEKDGIDYHFISEDEFKQKVQDGFFAEWKEYPSTMGAWYYGSAKEDIENADEKAIIILTPAGLEDIKQCSDNITSIYLYANYNTILQRQVARGDNKAEAERRIKADDVDFKGLELKADRIVYNNEGTSISTVTTKLLTEYNKIISKGEK